MAYLIILFFFSVLVINFPIFFKYKDDEFSRVIEAAITIIFLVLVIIRPMDIIPDTITYKITFDQIQIKNYGFNIFSREPNTAMEYGFVYLMVALKSLGLNFYVFTALITIFSIYCVYKTSLFVYKRIYNCETQNYYRIRYLYIFGNYMVYFGLFYNLITIRAMLAIDFLLLMSIAVLKKHYLRVLLFFCCAFLTHRMAILGLLFIVILNYRKSFITIKGYKNFLILLSILFFFEWRLDLIRTLIVSIFKPLLIFLGYMTYASKKAENGIGRMLQIIFWIINGWIIYFYLFKTYKNIDKTKMILKLLTIYLFGLIVAIAFCKQDGAYRIFDYFLIFSVFLNCLIVCNHNYLYKSAWRKLYFALSQNLFLLISFRSFAMVYLSGRS